MQPQEPKLKRRLGTVDATALALGAMIGAGIFVVLGEAARAAGSGLPASIVVAAAVATLNGLSSAELGVRYPLAGGAYEFGYRLLRPVVGFSAGWVFLLAGLAASTTYTLTFASYLRPLLPMVPLRVLAVTVAVAAVGVNVVGVRLSGRANDVLVALKVAALLTFVVVGVKAFDPRQLAVPSPFTGTGLLTAAALLFFAFSGYARPVTIVEEIRDPARTLPRAVGAALAISTGLYLAVAVVALGLVGAGSLASSPAPLRDALSPTGQVWAQAVVSVGALVAAASVLLTELWGLSRLTFAMARRRDLPRLFARLGREGTPYLSVLALGAVVVALTATVDLSPILAASSLSLLVYYAIVNAAALRLSAGERLYPAAVPAAGLVACGALAVSLPVEAALVVGGALAVGLLYWVVRRR